eukprot:gene2001-2685_t
MAFKEDCLKFTYNESTLDTLALDYVQQEQLVQETMTMLLCVQSSALGKIWRPVRWMLILKLTANFSGVCFCFFTVKTKRIPQFLASGLKERDMNSAKIQALVQAVGLPRQDAIESLKHTEGNIETAFMNELSRMRLNHALLDELVQEYACYRGLLDPDSGEASSASDAEVAEGDEGSGKRCMLKWVGRRAEDLALQYGRVMAMRAAVLAGQTDEVLRKLEVEEPGLLEASPQLLFDLKREQFMGMVAAGEAPRALQLAREELGPLSLKHPDLVPALKSTLVSIAQPALAPQAAEGKHAHELATTLQQALSKRLGLAEPRLIVLLRSLLHAHTEWFKLQRCEDPFRHIDEEDEEEEMRTSMDGVLNEFTFSEDTILTLMEFMALSRADAIQVHSTAILAEGGIVAELLQQHDGSVDTVIANLLT